MAGLKLAQEATPIEQDVRKYALWLHGPPGSGKTTWCSQIPGSYFIHTEKPSKGRRVRGDPCSSWADFVERGKLLIEGMQSGWENQNPITTIVIDIFENLWNFGAKQILDTMRFDGQKFDRIGEVTWGKAYHETNKLVLRNLAKLQLSGLGLVLVSHTKEARFKWDGKEEVRLMPNVAGSTYTMIGGALDAIGYLEVVEEWQKVEGQKVKVEIERRQVWQGNLFLAAKHNLEGFPRTLPNPREEGYKTYNNAFDKAMTEYVAGVKPVNEN